MIEAFDQAQAVEIARSAGLPRETVAITPGAEPLVLGWHHQKPSVDEIAAFDRVVARQRAEARVKLTASCEISSSGAPESWAARTGEVTGGRATLYPD